MLPRPELPHVILESLIYHVTKASTFTFDELGDLPYDYIDRIVSYMNNTAILPADLGRNFAIFGVPVALLSIAYKVSFLRQRVELDERDLMQAFELNNQLTIFTDFSALVDGPFIHLPLVSDLWACACKVLLAKIMVPTLDVSDSNVSTAVSKALRIARGAHVTLNNVVILWPLTILSLGTRNIQEYQVLRVPLVRLSQQTAATCMNPVVEYLDRSLHRTSSAPRREPFDLLLSRRLAGLRL